MISIKSGTQTWSKAEQTSALKPDPVQTMSVNDKQGVLGEKENIGEVLNKIADPNWVDPVKTRRVGNSELGKDAFLKLLLAQMKNQDPTSPMQSHEMAAQLAQFTSLEKLQSIDDSMKSLNTNNNQGEGSKFETLNLIGKAVTGDSAAVIRNDATEEHDINFSLLKDATKVKLTIKDAQGTPVRELDVNNLKAGSNKVTWNGINNEGAPMGKGEYRIEIEAFDFSGRKVGAETKFSGVITGVNFSAEGPVLMMGKQKIKLKDVRSITTADQVHQASYNQVNNEVKQTTNDVAKSASTQAVLDNVAMSRGIINKLGKQTGNQ
ncbi:MAG: flagellar biosynthesis protein FlgD [Bdellovibrionales bacterium]|nr:flagellar biosynthesis protein FlgD [Bdellovibrionales bacterium]